MKAKYLFEIMDLDDGLVAVPVGSGAEQFHGVLKINDSAMSILKLLEQDLTEKEIVESLVKEYDGDETTIANYVHDFIVKLQAEGIID